MSSNLVLTLSSSYSIPAVRLGTWVSPFMFQRGELSHGSDSADIDLVVASERVYEGTAEP